MIEDWFYRHARDLRWDMFDPVSDGRNLYTRYLFSYVSTVPEAPGRRVMFEGVGLMRLEGGLIASYREVANTGPALLDMGFPPERVAKILTRCQCRTVSARTIIRLPRQPDHQRDKKTQNSRSERRRRGRRGPVRPSTRS